MQTPSERLRFTLKRFGCQRTQGRIARQLGINESRFSRILNGAPMYDYELTAVVGYFPGLTYRWLLEGITPDLQRDLAMDALAKHIAGLSEEARFNLINHLQKNGEI